MAHPALALAFGILGNIASFISFAAPLSTFIQIYRGKTVFEYRSLPYAVSLLSQFIWLYYGCILQRGGVFIIVVSVVGCVFQSAYLAVYVRYAADHQRRYTVLLIIADVAIFATIFLITFFVIRSFPLRHVIVGWLCVGITIASFGAPLAVMWQVIRTTSVESMPIALSLALTLNASMWLAYGLVTDDPYIMIPNVLGLVLAGIQMILYGFYRYALPAALHFLQTAV